jgi:hypothetical protein
MRKRRQPSPGGIGLIKAPTAPSTGPALTWFRVAAGGSVIDFPLHLTPGAQTWVATIWADPRAGTGWAGLRWRVIEGERGFIPGTLELGDVIEFGVRHSPTAGAGDDQGENRFWHGYLHSVRADGIVLHGPFPGPHQACAAAQHALLAQIHDTNGISDEDPWLRGGPSRPNRPSNPRAEHAPVPAQPPVSVSLAFHGRDATVGDPVHGWLVVDSERLVAAMARPADDLRRDLASYAPLTGHEPALTLAALAAYHLPGALTLPSALTDAIPESPTDPPTGPPPSTAGDACLDPDLSPPDLNAPEATL